MEAIAQSIVEATELTLHERATNLVTSVREGIGNLGKRLEAFAGQIVGNIRKSVANASMPKLSPATGVLVGALALGTAACGDDVSGYSEASESTTMGGGDADSEEGIDTSDSDSGETGETGDCSEGELGCPCNADGSCNTNLICIDDDVNDEICAPCESNGGSISFWESGYPGNIHYNEAKIGFSLNVLQGTYPDFLECHLKRIQPPKGKENEYPYPYWPWGQEGIWGDSENNWCNPTEGSPGKWGHCYLNLVEPRYNSDLLQNAILAAIEVQCTFTDNPNDPTPAVSGCIENTTSFRFMLSETPPAPGN